MTQELDNLQLAWNGLCGANDNVRKAIENNIKNNICMRSSYNNLLGDMAAYTESLRRELLYVQGHLK